MSLEDQIYERKDPISRNPNHDHMDQIEQGESPLSPVDFDRICREGCTLGNELALRTYVSRCLLERGIAKDQRQKYLRLAIKEYRARKVPAKPVALTRMEAKRQGLKVNFFGKSDSDESASESAALPDAKVDSVITQKLIDLSQKKGWLGFEFKDLTDLIHAHGPESVSHALRHALETKILNHFEDRFYQNPWPAREEHKPLYGSVLSADFDVDEGSEDGTPPTIGAPTAGLLKSSRSASSPVEQRPSNTTIGVSPLAEEIGARKIWNKRVVQKMQDGRWHVVGHVAGLENPGVVPQLDFHMLDRDNLLHLLQQLVNIRHASVRAGFHDTSK